MKKLKLRLLAITVVTMTIATVPSIRASATNEKNILSSSKVVKSDASTDYLEDYRQQYHFSVSKAWANDPNGMVYFNGEWHLFYQYYPDDVVWGPMHWGHAVSKDLIHWEELDIALYPGDAISEGDGKRYIFSGSAVVDKDNTSGFFDGIKGGGLVAIYTTHTELDGSITEEQSIAYSKDNGRSWIKYNGGDPVLTVADDPLNKGTEFRDPKVFYNDENGKWMMVIAGGPLRFFSSTDLKNWEPEGMQLEINTECPDIFKLEVEETGTYKWILSEGGRYYRVGDFKEVDGVWKFVPDSDQRFAMNFVKDSYAAQTYYGVGENGTPDGRRIMINWMNNWDYCNAIAPITKTFNGQFTLQNELKLVQTDEGIRLIQQPIEEYETLRNSSKTFKNVTISPDKPNIMSKLSGSQYEIIAEFEPDENTTEVGFKLRVGEDAGQETIVKYNTETEEVTIDRSKSGRSPSNSSAFLESYSSKMNKTSEGKIQLHIFVDSSSVELYGNNGEVAGTAQIFPNRSSEGIEVYSLGGKTKATIKYYPLSGIWNNDIKGKNSTLVSLSEGDFSKELGEQFSIYTTTIPTKADQGVIWSISNSDIVKIISQSDEKTTFEVIGIGNVELIATSKDGKSTAKSTLNVYNRDVPETISNLTNFKFSGTEWYVDNNAYIGDGYNRGDGFAMADEKNDDLTATYIYKATAKILDNGNIAGVVLFSQSKDRPTEGSLVGNISNDGDWRLFKFPSGSNVASGKVEAAEDGVYNLEVQLKGSHINYIINDVTVYDGDSGFNNPGYFGLNVFNSKTEFTNVFLTKVEGDNSTLELNKTEFEQKLEDEFTVYTNQAVYWSIEDKNIVQIVSQDNNKTIFKVIGNGVTTITAASVSNNSLTEVVNLYAYATNPESVDGLLTGLEGFEIYGGSWYIEDGAYVVNTGAGTDGFAIANNKINVTDNPDITYTLEANAEITSGSVASLVLFCQDKSNPSNSSLVANVNNANDEWRLFKFPGGSNIANGFIMKATDSRYHLKVELKGSSIKYFINDVLVYEGTHELTSGYLGLNAWNSAVNFTNIKFTAK